MIRSHFVESGPGPARIDLGLCQTRHTHRGMGQDFFDEGGVEFSFETHSLFGIVPRQENSLPAGSENPWTCQSTWEIVWATDRTVRLVRAAAAAVRPASQRRPSWQPPQPTDRRR